METDFRNFFLSPPLSDLCPNFSEVRYGANYEMFTKAALFKQHMST